ncbi:hypothetical protein ACWF5H_12740 [Arthrobacter sp. NPDC055138]
MTVTQASTVGQDIKARLERSSHKWIDYFEECPDATLSWRIVNSLAFIVDGDPIEYAAGTVHGTYKPISDQQLEIVLFTDKLVVHYLDNPQKSEPAFEVFPRNALTGFTVRKSPDVMKTPNVFEQQAPSAYAAYRLTYGILPIDLPLHPDSTHQAKDPLAGLCDSLKADLLG